jgi:hypothetical protein
MSDAIRTPLQLAADALAARHVPQHFETACWQALAGQLAKVEAALAVLTEEQALAAPVLTTAEAMRLTKHASQSAFVRWAIKWGVTNSQNGRWPRQRLDAGLFKEARMGGSRRPRKVAAAAVERIAA